MKQKLEEIKRLSRERAEAIEEMRTVREIEPNEGSVPRTPRRTRGIAFTEEGVATPKTASQRMNVSFNLPAKEISFNFQPARYEVRLKLNGASVIDVYDISSGQSRIKSRRTTGRAVLDLSGSGFRIESKASIEQAEVYRFGRRQEGMLIAGPFRAEGIVSASVVGEGTWTAEVASAPEFEGRIDYSQRPPAYDGSGTVWRGSPPEKPQTGPPQSHVSGAVVSRVSGGPALDLQFYQSVRASTVLENHEEVTLEETTPLGEYLWWNGIGEWMALAGTDAPSLDPRPGLWTHLWGSAENVDVAYSLRTGKKATPSSGAFLVRTESPEKVKIDGTYGRTGRPLSKEDRATLPPGTYWRAEQSQAPGRVYVRIEGSGVARKIELSEKRRLGPKGMEVTDARRIDLADFFRPGTMADHAPVAEGAGAFLPVT